MKQKARLGMLCALSSVLLLTSGCAAIVGGTNQPLSVETRSADGQAIAGADCKLHNSKGTWYTTTPGSVTIHRSFGDLDVSCSKSGTELGTMIAKSTVRGWFFGNLLFGGVIGIGVDIGTGAGFDYPAGIIVAARHDDATQAERPVARPVVSAEPSLPAASPKVAE